MEPINQQAPRAALQMPAPAELGQVFTRRAVADFMVSLFTVKKEALMLDPCFGAGVFIDSLQAARGEETALVGMELDKRLFSAYGNTHESGCCRLICGDFLRYKFRERFDGIIMNPPYIRQEKIDALRGLGVTKSGLKRQKLYASVPGNGNLYMYFILKGISLLKPGGELVVIFPDTWQRAANGVGFKEAIERECNIVRTIYVRGEAFETSALVDVLILKIVKDKSAPCMPEELLHLEDGRILLEEAGGSPHADSALLTGFLSCAGIRRGITTGNNKMYINPPADKVGRELRRPILSSPRQVSGYTTVGCQTDELLCLNGAERQEAGALAYVAEWKERILKDRSPKTQYTRIKNGDQGWYRTPYFCGRGILFGYIVRNDMRFIRMDREMAVRDNFYLITPKIEELLLFALLNNHYTFLQLENSGKRYGAGVLKLQKYDLEGLMLAAPDKLTEADAARLRLLAGQLEQTGESRFVEEITMVLSDYMSMGFEAVCKLYDETKRKRLGD